MYIYMTVLFVYLCVNIYIYICMSARACMPMQLSHCVSLSWQPFKSAGAFFYRLPIAP